MFEFDRLTVTGIDVYLSITAIFVVCIFYTVVVSVSHANLNNLRTINISCQHFVKGRNESCHVDRYATSHHYVWCDDSGKRTILFCAGLKHQDFIDFLQVIAKGHVDVGGWSAVWNANHESGRIEFAEY